MNDRDIVLTALAGVTEENSTAGEALAYAFERAVAEAWKLVEKFDMANPATDYLMATAHAERLEALAAFIDRHLFCEFHKPTEIVSEVTNAGPERAQGNGRDTVAP